MEHRNIMTLPEVADLTRIPLATLRYYRAMGQGPMTWKLGGRVVAYEDDIQAWVDAQYEAERVGA